MALRDGQRHLVGVVIHPVFCRGDKEIRAGLGMLGLAQLEAAHAVRDRLADSRRRGHNLDRLFNRFAVLVDLDVDFLGRVEALLDARG